MNTFDDQQIPRDYRVLEDDEARRVDAEILQATGQSNRKVLIVGGAGYVGSVLTDQLLKTGYNVRCLDSIVYRHGLTVVPFLSRSNYEFVQGDFSEPGVIEQSLDGITDVVLLAGLVGDPVTKKYPGLSAQYNDVGYEKTLDALCGKKLNKVVFVSTCSNYGMIPDDALADEAFPLNPLSLYAKSKVHVEEKLLGLKGQVDFAPTVLRFATAFGLSPRMRFDLTVSEFTRALSMGEELLVYDADTWRPYCHLLDFSRLIGRVLKAPRDVVSFEVFNAGGDVNNFTKQMIVDAILAEVPDGKVQYQEHGGDPRNYRVDFSKVRNRLHFEPMYTVADGIRELVGAMQQGLFVDIDQPISFYGNWIVDGAS